ncbi:hypothetical protein AB6A40_001491 [Gnathostoma spinigerum]|uniref:MRG domain-containing protein n=1 Tax=Gnathostoma spinigerum TaxID=75299 RepID=A0ABD6EE51_9BILA
MAKKDTAASKEQDGQSNASGGCAQYELNSKVLCRHIDNLYYEAKVIAVEKAIDGELLYTVHYQGWNQRHDEKIKHSDTRDRFLEFTPANVEKAKADMREAQQRVLESKKKHRKSVHEEKKSGGSDSRASTPSEKRGASSSRAASIASDKGVAAASTSQNSSVRKRKSAPTSSQILEPVPDFVQKNEIKIELPNSLKEVLVDDEDLITRQMKLVRIPARVTISQIIKEYADYIAHQYTNKKDSTESEDPSAAASHPIINFLESSMGVQDYFDSTLGSQLLYKFERPQYKDLLDEQSNPKKECESESNKRRKGDTVADENGGQQMQPSNFYGFIHLLRLFVRLKCVMSYVDWSERSKQTIANHIQNFVKFLEDNREKFFDRDQDYQTASPEYQKRVWTT